MTRQRLASDADEHVLDCAARLFRERGFDRTMLRCLLFGAVNWTSMWYAPGGGLSPDEIADAFWRVVADGVVARRPTA